MAKKQIVKDSYKNEFGEIKVGDTVIAVTTGFCHRVSVFKAKYLGYLPAGRWDGVEGKKVKLEVERTRPVWTNKLTGKQGWDSAAYERGEIVRSVEKVVTTTTLQRNRIAPLNTPDAIETIASLV